MALAEAAKEVIWLKAHMDSFGVPIQSTITTYADTQSTIAMARYPVFHQWSDKLQMLWRYLKGPCKVGTCYTACDVFDAVWYCEAYRAACVDIRRSITGYVCKLCNVPVSTMSKLRLP